MAGRPSLLQWNFQNIGVSSIRVIIMNSLAAMGPGFRADLQHLRDLHSQLALRQGQG